jgi:hypothetical protein
MRNERARECEGMFLWKVWKNGINRKSHIEAFGENFFIAKFVEH